MPFLLMVFLVLVCLPDVEAWPEPWWIASPASCTALTWLLVLLSGLHAHLLVRRLVRSLEHEPNLRERLLNRYDRGRLHHQIVVFVLYILSLLLFGWGWTIAQTWRWHGQTLPGAELLVLAPFLAAQLFAWCVYYDAERAAYRTAHRQLDCEPNSTVWPQLQRTASRTSAVFGSRASYVLFQLRQKLALVFLPVLMLQLIKELQRFAPDVWQDWPNAINGASIVVVLVVFAVLPWMVRLMLGLKPLPAGPLRQRLQASARRLRFRHSDILLWDTRHGMANAMMIGILPWIRYVVFTDRLVDEFTAEEIEAVFGHEVGHVHHRHMLYYFSFFIASVIVLGWLAAELARNWPWGRLLEADNMTFWSAAPMVAVLLGYIFVVFGFLSRRCERQADVFGCRAVSCSRPDCDGHSEDPPRRDGGALCSTGIRTFIRALEKVAVVNGISRDKPGILQSWQHSTIARRVDFLHRVLGDANVERRFQRRIVLLKWLLLLVLGAAITLIFVCESNRPARQAVETLLLRPERSSPTRSVSEGSPRLRFGLVLRKKILTNPKRKRGPSSLTLRVGVEDFTGRRNNAAFLTNEWTK